MINPVFLASGIGMMLVGLIPVLFWRYRTLVPWKNFWVGAGIWGITIALKVMLDLTVTPLFVNWLFGIYTATGIALITGAYVGLRTGFFESGISYAYILKSKLKKFDFQQAVAFGLGFGCAEAFLIGISSFINIAVLMAFPQIIDLVPPAQRVAMLEQLALPSIAAFAPIMERAFTVLIHVFCSILVIQSVKSGKTGYLLFSILYKTLLDGMIPILTLTFDINTITGMYSIEAFVVALGTISIAGIFWIRGRFGKKSKHPTSAILGLIMILVATILVIVLVFTFAQGNVASQIERKTVNFDSFGGKYEFKVNGSVIGESVFKYIGAIDYNSVNAFVIEEETNLTTEGYDMLIKGTMYTTFDAKPLFYNMTIMKNGDVKNIECRFGHGFVEQSISENNETKINHLWINPDSFMIANNMISNWALLFRSAKLGSMNTYIVHIYSPNIGSELVRQLNIVGVENIRIDGRTEEVIVFQGQEGNLNYVTPVGELLKIKNSFLEISLKNGHKEEGNGIFR